MPRPTRNIRTPAEARAEAQARREQMVAPSPAVQVFEYEDDDFGSSDEEMQNAFENTGSGAEDEAAESVVVDQEEEVEEEAEEDAEEEAEEDAEAEAEAEATPANILATLAAIEQEENRDALPDDNERLQHPLGPNAADADDPAEEPPEGVPTEYCPHCGYESNKGKFKHKSKRSKKFCTMSGLAYADKYVGPHTHGQPAPSDYAYVEKGPNSVWHEPADPLFTAKTWDPHESSTHPASPTSLAPERTTVSDEFLRKYPRIKWNSPPLDLYEIMCVSDYCPTNYCSIACFNLWHYGQEYYCGKCADEEEDRPEEEGAGAGGGTRRGDDETMGDDY